MAIDIKQFELDRMVTLLKSFDWGLVSSEFVNDRVQAKFQKTMTGKTQAMMNFELERVGNMLRAGGWSMVSSGFGAEAVNAIFEKVITGTV